MANATCVKCGGHSFELREHPVSGAVYRQNFIQCASCGGVVGVVPYISTNALLDDVLKRLERIERAIANL